MQPWPHDLVDLAPVASRYVSWKAWSSSTGLAATLVDSSCSLDSDVDSLHDV